MGLKQSAYVAGWMLTLYTEALLVSIISIIVILAMGISIPFWALMLYYLLFVLASTH
jgi:hypothetical protein